MGQGSSKGYKEPKKIESVYFEEFEAGLPSLEGKKIAVTGCTSGTGLICAVTCAKKGAAAVFMLNRPSARAEKARETVAATAAEGTAVHSVECDLSSFESVKKAAKEVASKVDGLDVLCCNAGVMALEDMATADGYDVQMQTNHLSHFLLSRELFPALTKASELRGEARIVSHTSEARKAPGGPLQAKYLGKNGGNLGGNGNSMFFGGARWVRYHMSKLANAVFTAALAERLQGTKVKATCAAPGLAATNLQVTTNQAGGMDSTWVMRFAQSAEDGTMPLLSGCLAPDAQNGDFYQPAGFGAVTGKAVKATFERMCTDPKATALLWEASEAAVGEWPLGK